MKIKNSVRHANVHSGQNMKAVHFVWFFSILSSGYGLKTNLSESLLGRLNENEKEDFTWLLRDLGQKLSENLNCLTIISDNFYNDMFKKTFFDVFRAIPIYKILVKDYEDLLSPNFKTLTTLLQARRAGCNAYIILIANGDQVSRFLKFGDKHRVLDTRAKFLLLYDSRLFEAKLRYLWKKIINVIFLRQYADSRRYEISTVPFPAHMASNYLTRRINTWRTGKFQYNKDLFVDKTNNLNDEIIRVAVFEHMPSVKKKVNEKGAQDYLEFGPEDNPVKYEGLEIQILISLSKAMNFVPSVYEPKNAAVEAWGIKQLNGSFSGLLGEVLSGRADMVLGNFHYTPHNLRLLDLSRPYSTQCLTFLTPESTTDNSSKTLILPFKLYMWIAIFITLFVCSVIFYGLAKFQVFLYMTELDRVPQKNIFWKDMAILWYEKRGKSSRPKMNDDSGVQGLYLFEKVSDSIMNTYSMLLLVSLPKMPTGWSLRMMTGWWWIYCLLVTVAYRASMTAILANPAQKITIDTLEELAESPIGCGGWGEQNKDFFITSLDLAGQKVGKKFEVVYETNEAIVKVSQGKYAYYENVYFHHHAKVKEKLIEFAEKNYTQMSGETGKDLHIMGNCVINMPISLGLQKNSPLKPKVDVFLQRVIEAGLIKKWLSDTMMETTVAESSINKIEIKALMDLKKFSGALVALMTGYVLSTLALAVENVYWYRFVIRRPTFDKYPNRNLISNNM